MRVNGNLNVVGLIKDLKVEMLDADPENPAKGRIWFSNADQVFKYFDGDNIQPFAAGANLDSVMQLDGSTPMTGDLVLSSDDQTESEANVAVSKGYMESLLAGKQGTINGAVSSVLDEDLAADRAVITDESGKISAATTTTAAEIEHVAGATSNLQEQIDNKQANLGYEPVNRAGDSMTGVLDMNGNRVTGVGASVEDDDAVTKAELESAIMGLDWQADVLNVQVDADLDPGVEPAIGDRYILTDVSALHENFGDFDPEANEGEGAGGLIGASNNDIVEFDGERFFVAYSVVEHGEGALVWNRGGDPEGTFQYWNGTRWGEFGGVYGITAGFGLRKEGSTISVNKGAGISRHPDSQLGIDVRVDGGLWTTLDNETVSLDPAAQLALRIADETVETTENGLRVAASGINAVHLNGEVAGLGLAGGDGSALRVSLAAAGGLAVDEENGLSVDVEAQRENFLHRDGEQAMTGVLRLDSEDQTEAPGRAAVSKAFMEAAIAEVSSMEDALVARLTASHFVYEGNVASTEHVVVHNIGQKYVQVAIVDESDEVVIPQSVTYADEDSLVVTFSNEEVCRVICTAIAPAAVEEAPVDPEPTDPEGGEGGEGDTQESLVVDQDPVLLAVDGTEQLSVTYTDEEGVEQAAEGVVWSSSDDDVATVSETGEVTGVTEGEAVITATLGELNATCDVLVEAA